MTRPGQPHATTMVDLPDVNVWLALVVREHPHHAEARHYWVQLAAPKIGLCRVTMLGLVRLLTQPRLMGAAALGTVDALGLYEHLAALPEVDLLPEPADTDTVLHRLIVAGLPPRLLTDAYLAAFAMAGGLRLVSFDRDFGRFDGLDLLRLPAASTTTDDDTSFDS